MGFSCDAEFSFIHSHPSKYTTTLQEIESMGWVSPGKPYNPSDAYNVYINNTTNRYKNSYVYFPYSSNLYHVEGYDIPSFIRQINGNPQRLFLGH